MSPPPTPVPSERMGVTGLVSTLRGRILSDVSLRLRLYQYGLRRLGTHVPLFYQGVSTQEPGR